MSLGTLFIKCSDRRLARLLKGAGLQRLLFSFNLLGGASTSQHIQHGGPAWRRPEHARTSVRAGLGLWFPLHQQGSLHEMRDRVVVCSFDMKCVCFCCGPCTAVMMSLTRRLADTSVTPPTTRQTFYFLQTILSKQIARLPVPLFIWSVSSCFIVLPPSSPKSSCYFPEYAEFSHLAGPE